MRLKQSSEKPIFLFRLSDGIDDSQRKNDGVPWDTAVQGRICLPVLRDANIVGWQRAARGRACRISAMQPSSD
jgi:hypothetical protein